MLIAITVLESVMTSYPSASLKHVRPSGQLPQRTLLQPSNMARLQGRLSVAVVLLVLVCVSEIESSSKKSRSLCRPADVLEVLTNISECAEKQGNKERTCQPNVSKMTRLLSNTPDCIGDIMTQMYENYSFCEKESNKSCGFLLEVHKFLQAYHSLSTTLLQLNAGNGAGWTK